MGVWILVGVEAGTTEDRVALFDSVDGWAFGPTFRSHEAAEGFLAWMREHPVRRPSGLVFTDPRGLAGFELRDAHDAWRRAGSPEAP